MDFVLSKPYSKGGEWNNTYTFDYENYRFTRMEFVHELQNLYFGITREWLTFRLK